MPGIQKIKLNKTMEEIRCKVSLVTSEHTLEIDSAEGVPSRSVIRSN
jgi:hypothetical protein